MGFSAILKKEVMLPYPVIRVQHIRRTAHEAVMKMFLTNPLV